MAAIVARWGQEHRYMILCPFSRSWMPSSPAIRPPSELPMQRRHALASYVGGYISIGKLAEALAMHVLDLRRWLSEHGIEQNTAMSADDHLNA